MKYDILTIHDDLNPIIIIKLTGAQLIEKLSALMEFEGS